MPGSEENSIATGGGAKTEWFKDSEGISWLSVSDLSGEIEHNQTRKGRELWQPQRWMRLYRKEGCSKERGSPRKTKSKSLLGLPYVGALTKVRRSGRLYEHTFNRDGSVEYREVTEGQRHRESNKGKACGCSRRSRQLFM